MKRKRDKVKKIVIPIAGFGTRMFPASKLMPKALFPCLNPENGHLTPVISMIIEHAVNGLSVPLSEISIGIIISPSQRKLMESFFYEEIPQSYHEKPEISEDVKRFINISKRVHLIDQPNPAGFGDAIRCAKKFVGNEYFIVMIGDHLFTSPSKEYNCVRQLIEKYENPKYDNFENFTSITMCNESILSTQGVMTGQFISDRVLSVSDIVEKPPVEIAQKKFFNDQNVVKKYLPLQNLNEIENENYYLSFFGIELFSPKIFEAVDYAKEKNIRHSGEINMRDSQRIMIQELKSSMMGVVIEGRRLDVGLPKLYLESINIFYEREKKRE